jgi:hypothetical protein
MHKGLIGKPIETAAEQQIRDGVLQTSAAV